MAARTDMTRALSFLDGRRDEMVAILEAWCAINTGSRNLEGLAAFRGALAAAFAELGGAIETVEADAEEAVAADGRLVARPIGASLRIVRRPEAPVRMLLAGHMDTVFPADHPFQQGRLLDADTYNAPGAADMKGGILAMLYALKALEASPFAARVGYEVILNADEEIGSPGSARLLGEAARRAQFACVYEPALEDGTLAGARKGSGNYSATIRGRSAHAGRDPAAGRNAVLAAAEFAQKIAAIGGARDGLTVNVAKIEGGGPNNVVPDLAVVRFNVRVALPGDMAFAEREIRAALAGVAAREGFSAHLHGGFNRPPKPMTPALARFFEAVKSVGAELGLAVGWKATGGVCDGNNIAAAGVPVIDTLGARGANIHSADEYVKLDSLVERARLSALLFLRVAAGDIPAPGAEARP